MKWVKILFALALLVGCVNNRRHYVKLCSHACFHRGGMDYIDTELDPVVCVCSNGKQINYRKDK